MTLPTGTDSHVLTALLLIGLFAVVSVPLSGDVHAQDVPIDVPDEDGESPADRVREQLTERHRSFLSRLFMGSRVGAAPALARNATALNVRAGAGLDLGQGSSFYGAVGAREFVLRELESTGRGRHEREKTSVLTLGLGYALGLERLVKGAAFAKRSALGLSAEAMLGDLNGVVLELSPEYEIPVNQYWSLPVGVSVGSRVGEDLAGRVQRAFFSFNIGVKLHHYAWYDRLK